MRILTIALIFNYKWICLVTSQNITGELPVLDRMLKIIMIMLVSHLNFTKKWIGREAFIFHFNLSSIQNKYLLNGALCI